MSDSTKHIQFVEHAANVEGGPYLETSVEYFLWYWELVDHDLAMIFVEWLEKEHNLGLEQLEYDDFAQELPKILGVGDYNYEYLDSKDQEYQVEDEDFDDNDNITE